MKGILALLGLLAAIACLGSQAFGQATAAPHSYSTPAPQGDTADHGQGDVNVWGRAATAPPEIIGPTAPVAPEPSNAHAPERQPEPLHRRPGPGDWLEAQLFFIFWGLVATMLALVICPRASLMTAAAIENEPMRCAAVGTVGLLAIGLFNVINSILFEAALWAPVGILFFVLSMVIFVFSAILGIVFIGSGVARRFGWHGLGFFGRAAAGFATLALFNCIPLASMASMGLQCVAVLCGLGGLIVTGFGSDPNWLTRILSGNRPK